MSDDNKRNLLFFENKSGTGNRVKVGCSGQLYVT